MKICVITIATGRYIQFVENLLEKVDEFFLNGHEINCLLFTDNELDEVSDNVKVSKIEHKPWPEPALKKYNYIFSENEHLKDFDYLYLFDADVDVVDTVGEEVLQDLVGVLHPWKILEDKSVYPYEKREQSTAYVSDDQHNKYYAAAFVGGKSENFLKMAEVISLRVEEDEIVSAMKLIWERMKIIVEPSSAVAFAALLKEKEKIFDDPYSGSMKK